MSLFYRLNGQHIVFFGPGTFLKKERIKALGGRFNGQDKTWIITDSAEAQELIAALGAVGPVGGPILDSTPKETLKNETKYSSALVNSGDFQGLTVSQLMAEAQQSVSSAFPNPIWVLGEIQNLSQRGENIFFEIAEAKSGAHATATITVKATLWGSNFKFLERRHSKEKLAQVFVDGSLIRAYVRVGLYKDRGQITLTVEDVDPVFSQGALALARADLLKKLRASGLDKKNKSLVLPSFPLKVAFISAPESRAQSDFQHQLIETGGYPGTLVFIACPMQGDRVPKAVVDSIDRAVCEGVDLVVLSRGGGSAADLRWFDGEEIATAIANCPIPVISAIGHHDDHCVAESVSHTREKTPTAAADFILEIFRQTKSQLNDHAQWLATSLDREMTQYSRVIEHLRLRFVDSYTAFIQHQKDILVNFMNQIGRSFDKLNDHQNLLFVKLSSQLSEYTSAVITTCSNQLFQGANRLERGASNLFTEQLAVLNRLEQALIKIDPGPWLNSGWTQLRASGKLVQSVLDLEKGSEVTARLKDGQILLSVLDKRPEKK